MLMNLTDVNYTQRLKSAAFRCTLGKQCSNEILVFFVQNALTHALKKLDENKYLMWDIVEGLLRRWLWWRSLGWLLLLLLLVLLQG